MGNPVEGAVGGCVGGVVGGLVGEGGGGGGGGDGDGSDKDSLEGREDSLLPEICGGGGGGGGDCSAILFCRCIGQWISLSFSLQLRQSKICHWKKKTVTLRLIKNARLLFLSISS